MNDNNIIKFPENLCPFCGKREVTKICDKAIGSEEFTGYYTKETIILNDIITCDKMMCNECVTHITGADFCPDCIKDILNYFK